tara:strand:- start:316 stop:513 length:198 start_codon:yes stop_codon:yes gene_type:complete
MFKTFEAIKYNNIEELINKTTLEEYSNHILNKLIDSKLLEDYNIEKLKKNIDKIKFNFLIENIVK